MSTMNKNVDMHLDNVIDEISPSDEMFQGNREHYFDVGQSALRCIKLAIMSAGKEFKDINTILDLPCGYGRIMRMLKAAFPNAQITGSDLLREGVDFCARVFGSIPLLSDKDIKNVVPKNKYDLIWCGSLLTHLNSNQWPEFLSFFSDVLNPNGILVFTTHGRTVVDSIRNNNCDYGIEDNEKLSLMVKDFSRIGFGFSLYFHSNDYGISLSSPSYVLKLLEKYNKLRILTYLEKGWDNHQDVIACIKNTN